MSVKFNLAFFLEIATSGTPKTRQATADKLFSIVVLRIRCHKNFVKLFDSFKRANLTSWLHSMTIFDYENHI